MYKHILIATDGSELGSRGVTHGVALAKALDARVTIVTVTESWSAFDLAVEIRNQSANPIEKFEGIAETVANRILGSAADRAKQAGLTFNTTHVPDRYPAEGIIATAETHGCDLIVMASHGRRGIGRMVLGSQAFEVVTRSKIPTLIVR
jgi:Universal stress protein UspA and related nucleotide-binding proteins